MGTLRIILNDATKIHFILEIKQNQFNVNLYDESFHCNAYFF